MAGLTDGPVLVEHPGRARCLQVDLAPLAARRLLGVRMGELANRSVGLERLGHPGGPVGDLARELGWSHRRLITRFRGVASSVDAPEQEDTRCRHR